MFYLKHLYINISISTAVELIFDLHVFDNHILRDQEATTGRFL